MASWTLWLTSQRVSSIEVLYKLVLLVVGRACGWSVEWVGDRLGCGFVVAGCWVNCRNKLF